MPHKCTTKKLTRGFKKRGTHMRIFKAHFIYYLNFWIVQDDFVFLAINLCLEYCLISIHFIRCYSSPILSAVMSVITCLVTGSLFYEWETYYLAKKSGGHWISSITPSDRTRWRRRVVDRRGRHCIQILGMRHLFSTPMPNSLLIEKGILPYVQQEGAATFNIARYFWKT